MAREMISERVRRVIRSEFDAMLNEDEDQGDGTSIAVYDSESAIAELAKEHFLSVDAIADIVAEY